jgi:hypothetical protein
VETLGWILFGVAFAFAPFVGVALWNFGAFVLRPSRETEERRRLATRLANEARSRVELDETLRALPGWYEHVGELRRAGYNVPERPTDERWEPLRELVKRDLGRRWTHVGTFGRMPALTETVRRHSLALSRLNRSRLRRLGHG